jgi:hypothetical protein
VSEGSRKTQSGNAVVKYCSERCRHSKPGSVDRKIEDTFVALLEGKEPNAADSDGDAARLASIPRPKVTKGDGRILVECGTVEELVFGSRHDPEKVYGRRKNRATRSLAINDGEWKSVDMEDTDGSLEDQAEESGEQQVEVPRSTVGPMIRPAQVDSDVNGSIGGEKGWAEHKEETAEELEKRKAGQRRAEEREMVRRAGRRACAFGLKVEGTAEPTREVISKGKGKRDKLQEVTSQSGSSEWRRKCEAVMNGAVVEASFAKGDWAIRWRE